MNGIHELANDIRLLVVLDVLLEEANATRAAQRLGVTQSSVSHSLRRLRELLDDDLFVRSGRTLRPTPRALALRMPLRDTLRGLGELVRGGAAFDAKTSRRTVTIIASDLFASAVLPKLMRTLRREAPEMSVAIKGPGPHILDTLETGGAELAFGFLGAPKRGFHRRKLFEDDFTCLVRREHPRIRGKLTLDAYLGERHVLVTPTGRPGSKLDDKLARRGKRRDIALMLPHFMAAGLVVANSDLITTMPTRAAAAMTRQLGLRRLPPPLPGLGYEIYAYWHGRVGGDAAVMWLLDRATQASGS